MARRMRASVVWAIAAVAVGVTGCTGQPGSAATVGDRSISESDVARFQSDGELVMGQVPSPAQALETLIVVPELLAVAADSGVVVSEQEARALLDDVLTQVGAEAPEGGFGDGVVALAQMQLTQAALNEAGLMTPEINESFAQRLLAADVEVSPRYGEFNTEQLTVVPTTPDWIATARQGGSTDEIAGGFGSGPSITDLLPAGE